MARKKRAEDDAVTVGSGNVFADLGMRDPEQLLAKAQLVDGIRTILRNRNLTQQRAAVLVGLTQPKISALLCGDTKGFSCDRLMRILTLLGQDVEITIAPAKRRSRGSIRVHLAA
jgi:predicted XRE-type DNA-binding protein